MDLIVAQHGVRNAIKIANRILIFQANLDYARPMATLQETRQNRIDQFLAGAAALLHEIGDGPADDLLKRQANQVGKPAVDGAKLAIQSGGQQNIVKRIDQIPIALLRSLDDREKLIHLLTADRSGVPCFNSTNQPTELGNFVGALPGIDSEQCDEHHEAEGQGFKTFRKGSDGAPGCYGKNDGEDEQQEKSQAPQLALTLFELR